MHEAAPPPQEEGRERKKERNEPDKTLLDPKREKTWETSLCGGENKNKHLSDARKKKLFHGYNES